MSTLRWMSRGVFALVSIAVAGACEDSSPSPVDDDDSDDTAMEGPASTHELEHEPVDAGNTGSGDARVADSASAVDHDGGASVEGDAGSDPAIDSGSDAPDGGTDAGEVTDAAPSEELFTAAYALIEEHCAGCHSAGKTIGDFSTREIAYAQLVGVHALGKSCAPADASVVPIRVVAGDADASLLIQKLENHQTCGKQMPPSMLLPQESVDVLRAWVAAGAPEH